ncbi:MAG: 6-phosphogluconolactonase (cycloisomerase 2 family), partial [Gammaproteobacteria bacterium]
MFCPRISSTLFFNSILFLVSASMTSMASAAPGERASFAYVANADDDTLSIFAIDADSGRMSNAGYQAAASGEEAPRAVVVHPNGDYLFVANADTANLSTYTIDPSNGRLTALAPTATGIGPHDMALGADGSYLYVTAFGSDAVYTYSVDALSGALTQVGAPLGVGAGPDAIAIDPLGRFAYVTTRTAMRVVICDINGATGALGLSVPALQISPGVPADVVVDQDGTHAYVSVENFDLLLMYSIDGVTGALASIGSRATGAQPSDLALRPGGAALYLINVGDGNMTGYALDEVSGLATSIPGDITTGLGPDQVIFDPSSLNAYVTNAGSRDISCYTIDGFTQAASTDRRMRGRNTPGAIALRDSGALTQHGRHLYALNGGADTISSYVIDPDTGDLSSAAADVSTAAGAVSLAADPLGRFLYTVDATADRLSTYVINPGTGALNPLATMLALAGTPIAGAVDPSGLYLYVALGGLNLVVSYSIDQATGLPAVLDTRAIGDSVTGIAVDPTGQFVYMTRSTGHIEGFRVTDGVATGVNFQIGAPSFPQAIRFSPTGEMGYVALRNIDLMIPFLIDAATGVPTLVQPGNTTGDQPGGLAFHPSGAFAYAPMREPAGTGALETFTVDALTGDLNDLVSSAAGTNPRDVVVDASGRFLFVVSENSNDVTSFAIDPSTGAPVSASSASAGSAPFALVMTTTFVAQTPPDCNSNGMPDDMDIAMGTSLDCNGDCIPDECETDCNANGIPDDCDLAFGGLLDVDMNGVPDECECGSATNYCVTSPHTAGPGAIMGYAGTLDVGANNLSLLALECPPEKFGIFFYGTSEIQVSFGEGFRCVGGMTYRINPATMSNM